MTFFYFSIRENNKNSRKKFQTGTLPGIKFRFSYIAYTLLMCYALFSVLCMEDFLHISHSGLAINTVE